MPAEVGTPQAWVGPYLRARELEGRLYPDSIVANLPDVPPGHPLAGEWRLRARSAARLAHYLARLPAPIRVVELGCGNGWLANLLARIPGSEVAGVDGNPVELEQARRVFGSVPNLRFSLADMQDADSAIDSPTAIVLASAIQYVSDLAPLLESLLSQLAPGGEIHILDSPLYSPAEVQDAASRSRAYYERLGVPEMADLYHHHTWPERAGFEFDVLYRPRTVRARLGSALGSPDSPFPWLRIRRGVTA